MRSIILYYSAKNLSLNDYIKNIVIFHEICIQYNCNLIIDPYFSPLSYFYENYNETKNNYDVVMVDSKNIINNYYDFKNFLLTNREQSIKDNYFILGDELQINNELYFDNYGKCMISKQLIGDEEQIDDNLTSNFKELNDKTKTFIRDIFNFELKDENQKIYDNNNILYFNSLYDETSPINDVMNFPFYSYRIKIHLENKDLFLCNNKFFIKYIKTERKDISFMDTEDIFIKFMQIIKSKRIKYLSAVTEMDEIISLCSTLYNIPITIIH
jgi:hypothetical protein